MTAITTIVRNEIEARTGKKLPRFTEIPVGYYKTRKKFTGIGYIDDWMQQVFWMKKGTLHRIDGPAVIDSCNRKSFYVHGDLLTEEEYWGHPLVVDHKLKRILEL